MTWIADRGRAFPIVCRLNESAFRFSESGSQQSIPWLVYQSISRKETTTTKQKNSSQQLVCLPSHPTIASPGSSPPPPLNKFNLMFQFFNEQRDSVTRLIKTSSIISSKGLAEGDRKLMLQRIPEEGISNNPGMRNAGEEFLGRN